MITNRILKKKSPSSRLPGGLVNYPIKNLINLIKIKSCLQGIYGGEGQGFIYTVLDHGGAGVAVDFSGFSAVIILKFFSNLVGVQTLEQTLQPLNP